MTITILNSSRRKHPMTSSIDVQRWNSLISSHVKNGNCKAALLLLHKMQQEGFGTDELTYLSILKACSHLKNMQLGRLIHQRVIECCSKDHVALGNALIDMYAKCGNMVEAHSLFDALPYQDVVSWGAMIIGYVANGEDDFALAVFAQMQESSIQPDALIMPSILKACTVIGASEQGRLIHDQILRSQQELDLIIGSTLVDFYAKIGRLADAQNIFDRLSNHDVFSWGTLLMGYANAGFGNQTMELYDHMQSGGIKPCQVIFLGALKACCNLSLTYGRGVHNQIILHNLETDLTLGSAIVDMYGRCGSVSEAYRVFCKLPNRNMVTWGAMLATLTQLGFDLEAFELFEEMQDHGVILDSFIFTSILKVCSNAHAMQEGRIIHDHVVRSGLEKDVAVSNILVDFYSKSGSIEEARKLFDNATNKNIVAWGAIISGCIYHELPFSALEYFEEMQRQGIPASEALFLCALKACGITGSIIQGRLVHDQIVRLAIDTNSLLQNDLIDMYAKCGSLGEASKMFWLSSKQTLISWGALIEGYSQVGNHDLAMKYFEDMQKHFMNPDGAIFTSMLTACSHAGLVEEGHHYFESIAKHGLSPKHEQFNCLIDLLSRTGCVQMARDLLHSMPFMPDAIGWKSLLNGCRLYGDIRLGENCFVKLAQLQTNDSSPFDLMSKIYTDVDFVKHVGELQCMRRQLGALKKVGMASIEVERATHQFIAGCIDHVEADEVFCKLQKVSWMIKGEGYLPILEAVPESNFLM